jgi:hypothetical protein
VSPGTGCVRGGSLDAAVRELPENSLTTNARVALHVQEELDSRSAEAERWRQHEEREPTARLRSMAGRRTQVHFAQTGGTRAILRAHARWAALAPAGFSLASAAHALMECARSRGITEPGGPYSP